MNTPSSVQASKTPSVPFQAENPISTEIVGAHMELSEHRDLRSGRPCWTDNTPTLFVSDPLPERSIDVAIIGAGIMGAMLADRLVEEGKDVALFDRRAPAHGSTAASTALVLWAADVPLTHLAQQIGDNDAMRVWRRLHETVRLLANRLDETGIECARAERPELYLSGTLLDDGALLDEVALRQKAGLPSRYLEPHEVADRFGVMPRAAIVSDGAYELDPVQLTLQLLRRAQARGATVTFPCNIKNLSSTPGGIRVETEDDHAVLARKVIVATGYERALMYLPSEFSVSSSFAIATAPGTPEIWKRKAMIWEASSPYLYARRTADGRVIVGGADEEPSDAGRRNRLLETKAGQLEAGLRQLTGCEDVSVDCAWAAAFGSSPDGLPAIGPSHIDDRIHLCSGFGGNGVTFAALATDLTHAAWNGAPSDTAEFFDPYRFKTRATPL